MLCFCGCGSEVTSKFKKAVFASHHTNAERTKLRYKIYAKSACKGNLAPAEWRICKSCGEWFPIFRQLSGRKNMPHTCPEFVSPGCKEAYRVKQMIKGRHGYKYEKKPSIGGDFRLTECRQNNRTCKRYIECSDREFAKTGEETRWEFEIHGPGCYV